jgi:predicted glycosyltransferase
MSHPPTILFQAPNGIGLGHINRMAAIALAIRQREPDAMLPFVLQGGSHSLLETARLTYISLPDGPMLFGAPWGAAVLREASRQIIHGIGPELIVCDTIPHPPFISAAAEMKVPMALCARKTKDDRGYFQSLRKFDAVLDLVVIPHEPGEVDVPDHLRSRAHFVGNIVRPVPTFEHRLTIRASKQLVITGGGGGAPKTVDFYNLALEAFARCRRKDPHVDCVMVTGPLFQDWWNLRITEHVRVIPSEPALRELMAQADLVICQAGYNTVSEIRQLDVPCICIPAPRVYDDQVARAAETAQSMPHFRVFRENDPDALSDLIEACLTAPRVAARDSQVSSDGAHRSATLLLHHLAHLRERPNHSVASARGPSISSHASSIEPRDSARAGMPAARNPKDQMSWGKVGRNEPCPCGSGKKYKQCHGRSA